MAANGSIDRENTSDALDGQPQLSMCHVQFLWDRGTEHNTYSLPNDVPTKLARFQEFGFKKRVPVPIFWASFLSRLTQAEWYGISLHDHDGGWNHHTRGGGGPVFRTTSKLI